MDTTNVKDNALKENVLGALIITMSFIIIAISGSYAYFINKVEHVNPDNEGVLLKSGKLSLSFTTADGNYINVKNAGLIEAIDNDESGDSVTVDENALKAGSTEENKNYTEFTLSMNDDNTVETANYNLYFTEMQISENFRNKYVKWALYENGTLVKVGDFSNVTLGESVVDNSKVHKVDKTVSILDTATITKAQSTKNYKLYVWLENSDKNQANDCKGVYDSCIDLREGTLSMKIGFRAVTPTAGT